MTRICDWRREKSSLTKEDFWVAESGHPRTSIAHQGKRYSSQDRARSILSFLRIPNSTQSTFCSYPQFASHLQFRFQFHLILLSSLDPPLALLSSPYSHSACIFRSPAQSLSTLGLLRRPRSQSGIIRKSQILGPRTPKTSRPINDNNARGE